MRKAEAETASKPVKRNPESFMVLEVLFGLWRIVV
jgi:hypothetical protein